MKKKYKIIPLLVTLILLFINSKEIIYNFLEYTKLFYTKVFPTSFIMFIFSTLLIDYGLLNIIPINITNVYIYILSFISGFPSGSKYTRYLLDKNYISKKEANNLILFSHFPNPLFVLGPITSIIGKEFSIKILISIILSNFIILLFTKKSKNKNTNINYPNNFSEELSKTIISSFKTIILVYGVSVFFYLISFIITKYINTNPIIYVILSGAFDLTKGVFSTSIINNTFIKSLLILIFISFGSISIHMQVKSILGKEIEYKYFLIGRIISTIISIIIFILIK